MKKPKLSINFGDGGFQGWLVRHCEKMILGVIILLALWVIWGGYSLSGLEAGKSPDKLLAEAQSKRSSINTTSWDIPAFKSREVPREAANRVEVLQSRSIDVIPYRPRGPFNPSDFSRRGKRTDPTIYPPVKLKTVPLVTAMAYVNDKNEADPLADASAEGEKKPVRRPPAPKPAAGGKRGGRSNPMGGNPMGNSPTGDGMDLLGQAPEELGGGGMPGADMMPGGGMQGQGMGMGGTPQQTAGGYYQPPPNSIAKTRPAVVLMAVVEHERQWDEFTKRFENALDPLSERDQPNYLTYFVQRVDVTDDPDADPATIPEEAWTKGQLRTNDSLKDVEKWAGFPQDVLDPRYLIPVDPYVAAGSRIGLTHPLPPFVQRDLWEAMTHPDVPLASAANQAPLQNVPTEEGSDAESEDDIPGVPRPGGGRLPRGGGMAGMGGAGGMPGMGGAGGMPGMGGAGGMPGMGGAGGMPGMGGAGGMPGMGGAGGMPGMGGAGGMPGMGGAGGMPGMGGGMMGGGMMGGFGGTTTVYNTPLVKHKLIRFTDFTVEPGHKYRYRVCVVLDDPNHTGMFTAASAASLDAAVLQRLGADSKTYVQSAWSVASDVVSLPSTERFFVGKVEPESGQMIVENTRPVRREPTARAVAVVHDPDKGADVPAEQEVSRGFTFNMKAEVEVAHPIYGDLRKLKNYVMRTDAVVADILGGETIPAVNKDRKEKLTVPGEILIIDADGKLLVRDESEDVEDFQRYVPTVEEERPQAAAGGDGGPMGGMLPADDGSAPMGRGGRR